MGTEFTGPIEIWGKAEFPKSGLWDVHGAFKTYGLYANGVTMIISGDFPNGVKFIGSQGWIFVSRGSGNVTASDPVSRLTESKALDASHPALLTSVIGPTELHLPVSTEHHLDWLEAIKGQHPPIAPVEIAHRSCTACLLHHIAMKVDRKLRWDPVTERFRDDDAANAMVSRPMRAPYTLPVRLQG
jgi:hypothetical protein